MQATEIVSMVVSVGALVVNILTTVIKDRHDRKMKVDERNSSFRENTWKEVINLAEELIKMTSPDCFDDTINEIYVAKSKVEATDSNDKVAEIQNEVVKKINSLCLGMRTNTFLLQTKMNLLKIDIKEFNIVTEAATAITESLQKCCDDFCNGENVDITGDDICEHSIAINSYLCNKLAGFMLIK